MSEDEHAEIAYKDGLNAESLTDCGYDEGTYLFDCWHDGFEEKRRNERLGKGSADE